MKKLLRIFLMAIIAGLPWHAQAGSVFLDTLRSYQKCLFCDPFATIFDLINSITTTMCQKLQSLFFLILGLGFLFWLLFRVGKMVLDITSPGDGQLVPDLLKQILRVMVASLLLTFYLDVFTRLISPVLEMAINVGNSIYLDQNAGQKTSAYRPDVVSAALVDRTTLCPEYTKAKRAAAHENSDQVYPEVVKQAFVCYVNIGYVSMTTGMAVGLTAIKGWASSSLYDKLNHWALFFIGCILFIAFFLLLLAFPTKLFDPLLTLAFVGALFPVWVVCWAFSGTHGYYEKARGLFIGVLVHLIVISLVARLAIEVMNSALGPKEVQTRLYQKLLAGQNAYDAFTTTEGFGLTGVAVILTFGLAWLAKELFKRTGELAGQFNDNGSIINFGANDKASELVTAGTQLATSTGKLVISSGAHLARGSWNKLASRDDTLGKLTRGLGSVAVGAAAVAATPAFLPAALPALGAWAATTGAGVGAAAAAHRFMPVPKNRPHGSSYTDRLRVRRSEDATHFWQVNKPKGQSSAQDKTTHEFEKYDKNTQLYQEFDSASHLQNEYDRRRGNISLDGEHYHFSVDPATGTLTVEFSGQRYTVDLHNTVTNILTGLPVDPRMVTQMRNVANFQRHVEARILVHEAKLR